LDVIYQNADAAGFGVLQAARESGRALVFGSNGDQNAVAPDVILASEVIDLPPAFLAVARLVREGRLTGAVISLGAEADVMRLTVNPRLADRVPAAVRAQADSTWDRLARGELLLPCGDTSRSLPR
jgi:basic membrane lipoprotein Med (substrate-binding protein (PBP1-ABC) superfamily)